MAALFLCDRAHRLRGGFDIQLPFGPFGWVQGGSGITKNTLSAVTASVIVDFTVPVNAFMCSVSILQVY